MGLKWLLHSACHVLGYPNNSQIQGTEFLGVPNEPHVKVEKCPSGLFQMPLHYPRYSKTDYEKMEEWRVDMLLKQYGLNFKGTLEEKRAFAIGTFLWPHQY
ncbi:uncharacterized protein LOC126665085 [Mercurialis annua]|uniref:uncharacterized protein LOC126665085 n=1 Tax=Mercurialis annua TaxID=3986 RepID=UPI00215FD7B8|nr:uncharacterized protein LOC126665085 [Mercurialis annua]